MPTKKRKKLTIAQRRKNPMRIDPTRTVLLRSPMMAEIRRRLALLKGRIIKLLIDDDALGLAPVVNVFCATGPGGGVDPTCSPGGSTSATPTEPTTRVDKIAQAIDREASKVQFSTDEVSLGDETMSFDYDRGPRTSREYEELENALERDELMELQTYLDEERSRAVDDLEIDTDIDESYVASEAGYSEDNIRQEFDRLINQHVTDPAELERLDNILNNWPNNPYQTNYGTDGIRNLDNALTDVSEPLQRAINEYRDKAEEEIATEWQHHEDREREAYAESFLESYDDSDSRRIWLDNFWEAHGSRFIKSSTDLPDMVWAKSSDGSGDVLKFTVSSGAAYKVHAEPSNRMGMNTTNLVFSDWDGNFSVTKAGHAHEVFGKVTASITAYVRNKTPDALTFTAAEPSRRKLYDRLVKTLARVSPDYMAWTIDNSAVRQYVVVKRDNRAKAEEYIRSKAPRVGMKPEDLKVLVNERNIEPDISWFFPEGWADLDTEVTVNTRWAGQASAAKLKGFQQWLRDQNNQWLRGTYGNDLRGVAKPSMDTLVHDYIERGMKKGVGSAFDELNNRKSKKKMEFYNGTREQFLRDTFMRPVAREKVELMASKTFTDLEGITNEIDARLTRVLTDGLVQGSGSRDIARKMVKEVDISGAKAQGIAHDALMSVHAEGQLDALEAMGMDEVGVQVEWSTSGLGVTAKGNLSPCRLCAELEGVVLTIQEARGLLPRHRWCKCTFTPANVGEQDTDQIRTKRHIEAAVRASRSQSYDEDDWGEDLEIESDRPTRNAFCPTGVGGGIDNSCAPKAGSTATRERMLKTLKKTGGFTYVASQAKYQSIGENGYAVSPYSSRSAIYDGKVSKDDLKGFITKNRDLLSKPGHAVGAWKDPDTNKIYLDVSIVTGDKNHAVKLGKEHNQIAIFDFRSGSTIATGGTGEAGITKNSYAPGRGGYGRGARGSAVSFEQLIMNAFCPTGEGGGVDPSCSPGSGVAKVKGWVVRKLKGAFDKFTKRYGKAGAIAMMTAMVATSPLPGNVLGIIGIAEGVKKLTGNEEWPIDEMLKDLAALARNLGFDLSKQSLKAALATNAFCPTGPGGGIDNSCSSKDAYNNLLYRIGSKIRNRQEVSPSEWKSITPEDRVKFEVMLKDYTPKSKRPPESDAPIKIEREGNGIQQVSGEFTSTDKIDEYLYHVTTPDRADSIFKNGFKSGQASSMSVGFYRDYSRGKTFFAERNGVSYWADRIEDHLHAQTDDDPPPLVVLRVPRNIPDLAEDTLGSRDSRTGSYYVNNAFCPTGPGGGIDNSCPPTRSGSVIGGGAYSSYPPSNPKGRDSLEMYKDKNGNYTPERRALHNTIIDKQFSGKSEVDQPVAYLMGGGPAAGKSTLTKFLPIPSNRVDVAPDDILHDMPDYMERLKARDVTAGDYGYRESSEIGKSICIRAAAGKYNILVDGIGNNSVQALQSHATVLRQNGRKVVANYVTADVELAVQRNFERGQRTGRYVPEAAIRELHSAVSRIVPEAVKAGVFDEFNLWDTGAGGKPLRVASATGSNLTIHDHVAWQRFIAKGGPRS